MRKYIFIILGIIMIAGGIIIAKTLADSQKPRASRDNKFTPTVFVDKVENSVVPVTIIESGRLMAKNRIEVYAEVQGVMEPTSTEFKPGARYRKGEIIVKIRSNDFTANLQAQKSNLQNLITSILPDLRLDYPDVYPKWDAYLRNFNMDKPVAPLPETTSDKEKFFITGRNIYTSYYNTKNLEIILEKYNLKAPFSGILTEATVTPGTLVRQGQRLGEFIDPSVFELEVAVSQSQMAALSVGKKVDIKEPESDNHQWTGHIVRINGKVNPSMQTVNVFIQVSGEGLKEGMYLEAWMEGHDKTNAYEVERNLLVDEDHLYIVEDNALTLVNIEPVHFNQKTVIVKGLENGSQLVSKAVPGAYAGMKVELFDGE